MKDESHVSEKEVKKALKIAIKTIDENIDSKLNDLVLYFEKIYL